MILVVELPTPRIIKKKIKKYLTRERVRVRVRIYGLLIGGCIIVCSSSIPVKIIPISALLYCGFTYEIIEKYDFIIEDQELLEHLLRTYSNNMYF